jgi:hypothetical protein
MLVAIECGCGNEFEFDEENSWGKAHCPKCGAEEPMPGIDTGSKLLQVTPQVWKVLCACGQKLKLPRKLGGRRFQCPKCKITRKIPLPPTPQRGAQTDATLITGSNGQPINRMLADDAGGNGSQGADPLKEEDYESPPQFSLDEQVENHREAAGGLGPLAPEEANSGAPQSNMDFDTPWDADLTPPPSLDPQGIRMTASEDIMASAPPPPVPGKRGPAAPAPGNPPPVAGNELSLDQLDFSAGSAETPAAMSAPRQGTPLPIPGAQENLFDLPLDGSLGFTDGDTAAPPVPAPVPEQAPPPPAQPQADLNMDLGGLSFQNADSLAVPEPPQAAPAPPQPAAPMQGGLELGDGMSFSNGPEPEQPQAAGVCPGCSSPLALGVIICVQCGFNVQTGQQMGMPTMPQNTDEDDTLCGLSGDLVSYFNTTGGIDAAKAGIAQVLNGGWLYLPVALFGVLIWEAQLMMQDVQSLGMAVGLLGLTVVLGTLGYSAIIACVRDGIFQAEFGIKRLGYNSIRYWPAMIIGSLLNIPFVLLIGALSFVISWVMAAGMGPGAMVGGFVIAGGGITWFMFMSLLFPVATVFEGGNPIERFKNVMAFGLKNIHQIGMLAIAQIVISLGVLFTFWMIHFFVGGLIGSFLPTGLWMVIKQILAGFLFAELFGLAVSSIAMLYLSGIEDGSRLTAMANRIQGPGANPTLTKAVIAVMAAAVIGIGFTIPENKFFGASADWGESEDADDETFFEDEDVEDWEAKLKDLEEYKDDIPAAAYEKMKAEIQKRIDEQKQNQAGEAQGERGSALPPKQPPAAAASAPPSEPPAKPNLPPVEDPADFE